jgi:hypothetical protein
MRHGRPHTVLGVIIIFQESAKLDSSSNSICNFTDALSASKTLVMVEIEALLAPFSSFEI